MSATDNLHERQVDEAVAEYLEAERLGRPLGALAWLTKHAAVRDELERFLADRSVFARAAQPVEPQTLGLAEESTSGVLLTLRYFGDYELIEEIARGGMGVVFKARQVSLNRNVALKMILRGTLAAREDVQRFRTEAEAAANLDHPNIVPIYEVGEHEGQQYFAMKLIEGGTLAERLATLRTRADPSLLRIVIHQLICVARAVQFAHQRGILHRDLKPGNILLDAEETSYVADFGLARKIDTDSSMTRTGQVVGSPSYMSPEQARGDKVLTTAADVYSLGALLYEVVAGRPPFRAANVAETLRQVAEDEPPHPLSLKNNADRDLSVIALKCLAKDPARRYGTAGDFADDLARWSRGEPIVARPASLVEKSWRWMKRRPAQAAVVFSTIVVAALLISLGWASQRAQALAERAQKYESERLSSEGLHYLTYSQMVLDANPGLALILAVEGAERCPGPLANLALTKAIENCDEHRTLVGHTGPIMWADYNRDGSKIVTASKDKMARIWDAGSGICLHTLPGHGSEVCFAEFSPDGKTLVTVETNQIAKAWDVESGREIATLTGPGRQAFGGDFVPAHFSPDGSRIVTAFGAKATPGNPQVWDAKSGEPKFNLVGHTGRVSDACFSPDGKIIATASLDRTAKTWNAETGAPIATFNKHRVGVWRIAFGPDSKTIATIANGMYTGGMLADGKPDNPANWPGYVWNATTGETVAPLRWTGNDMGYVSDIAFSPDGKYVVTSGREGTAGNCPTYVWNAVNGQVKKDMGHLSHAKFRDDGKALTGVKDGKYAAYFDLDEHSARQTSGGHEDVIIGARYHPKNRYLLTWCQDATARIWRIDIIREDDPLGKHWSIDWAAMAPQGDRALSICWGRIPGELVRDVHVDDFRTNHHASFRQDKDGGSITSVEWSGDGRRVAIGSVGRSGLQVFDVEAGQLVRTIQLTSNDQVRISHDGSKVLAARAQTAWDVATGATVCSFGGQHHINSALFSRDGLSIITSASGQGVWYGDTVALRRWDAQTGKLLMEYVMPKDAGYAPEQCLFSHDGKYIMAGFNTGTVGKWLVADGSSVEAWKAHSDSITQLVLAPDGKTLMTTSNDRTACLWNLPELKVRFRSFPSQGGPVTCGAFNRTGELVATGTRDGIIQVWEASTRRLLHLLHAPDRVDIVAFVAGDRELYVAGWDQPFKSGNAWNGARSFTLDPLTLAKQRLPRILTPEERLRYAPAE